MPGKVYKPVGLLIVRNAPSDLEEYTDLFRIRWDCITLRYDLNGGVLPNGLLLRTPDNLGMVVYQNRLVELDRGLNFEQK